MKQLAIAMMLVAGGADALAQSGEPAARTTIEPGSVVLGDRSRGGHGRRQLTDFYSNVDQGPSSYLANGSSVHGAMDLLFLGRDENGAGAQTDLPMKVSQVEFWTVVSDGSSTSDDPFSMTITLDFYDEIVDWAPVPEPVNRERLAGFQVDIVDPNCFDCWDGSVLVDLGASAFTIPRGRCFVDVRCWEYSPGVAPTVVSEIAYPMFNGIASPDYEGQYPLTGFSADSFYFDANADGVYQRNERYFFGGAPFLANLMIALRGDDGCTMDFNGDGYVNGDDIDRVMELIDRGCP